jgi:hypothetical protein
MTMARRFNYRRVKIHRNYPIAELAVLVGAHKQTIGRWIAAGLPTTDRKRPHLVRGVDFHAFVQARRPAKQKCKASEFYCFRCRAPKQPAGNMANYRPDSETRGRLVGICPDCDGLIFRATTLAKIDSFEGSLDITLPKAKQRLADSSEALLNDSSNGD